MKVAMLFSLFCRFETNFSVLSAGSLAVVLAIVRFPSG